MTNWFSVIGIVAAVTLAGQVPAEAVMFDFNDLGPYQDGAGAISNYMTDLYGSDVTVASGWVGAGDWFGVDFGTDPYLFSQNNFLSYIDIRFSSSDPIQSLSFDGAVFDYQGNSTFRVNAYTDGGLTLVYSHTWNDVGVFSSVPITFLQPVDRLVFSDTFVHDVGIDDLQVTRWGENAGSGASAPVPASVALGALGLGAVGLGAALKKRYW